MPKKIAIIEDNDLNLKLFKDLLEANSFNVVYTQDGKQALDLISQERPDLVLMDIQLSHISGLDIIKQIKSIEELNNIPIIAVTAFAMREDKEKILESGCQAYISKPISIGPFIETIKKFVFEEA